MSNNKYTKDEYFITVGGAFMIGFFIGGIVAMLILYSLIKGII